MARIEKLPPPPANPVRSPPVTVVGEEPKRLGGRLEARLRAPARPRRSVVLCHPHPQYGGSMHSPVPLAIAKTLADKAPDVASIRFNFRGVGESDGAYDNGRGEVEDVRLAIEELTHLGAPIAVCGHSFGSWVGLRASTLHVDRVALIAPSTRFFTFDARDGAMFHDRVKIFIGDKDEFCDVEEARALARVLGADLEVLEGFDHHFTKSRRAMADRVLPFLIP
jgi:hypothetical protein